MKRVIHPSQQTARGGHRGGLDDQVERVEWPMPEPIPVPSVFFEDATEDQAEPTPPHVERRLKEFGQSPGPGMAEEVAGEPA